MTQALGIHDHPNLKLGKKPPSNAPRLKLSSFLDIGAMPPYDPTDDNFQGYPFQLYMNDTYGICGPTSVGNNVISVSYGSDVPTQVEVNDLYKRSGNPNFPQDDNGVVMQDMLDALLAGGLGARKPLAFAAVDHTNDAEMEAAVNIFDGILLGVTLETAQQTQTNAHPPIWDYRRSGIWGGHAIFCGRYIAARQQLDVVTWALKVQTTSAFRKQQLDEAWIVVWPEHINRPGVDKQALANAYLNLTGKTLDLPDDPAPVDPAPVNPTADFTDHQLWGLTQEWAAARHTGENKKAARAVNDWAKHKGLA
jgi:hypothetical protein